jgi:hypothetical protein
MKYTPMRCLLVKCTPMKYTPMRCMPHEAYPYEIHTHEMHAHQMHACEVHAYETHANGKPVRHTPMKHIPMKLWHSVPRALRSRRSIADTVTMKYRGFSRKSVCSLTRDIIPAAVLPDHVVVNVRRCSGRRCSSSRRGRAGHRCASGREAAVSSPPRWPRGRLPSVLLPPFVSAGS